MTAWAKLIENSALQSGTAWEHLHAQVGGPGGDVVYIERVHNVYGDTVITLMADMTITLEDDVIEVTLEPDYVITLEDEFKVGQ